MNDTLRRQDDRSSPSALEKGLMMASVLITAGLFGYVLYHAITAPDGVQVDVEVTNTTLQDDGLWVEVALRNNGSQGLEWIVVEVDCDEPAPQGTLGNVPAGGHRTLTLVCPPDAEGFSASVASFEPA